jgi:hypothetical protein
MIERAMAASTGGRGTAMKPSGNCEQQLAPPTHQHDQRCHEKQVVNAAQDVLDSKRGVTYADLHGPRARHRREYRRARVEAFELFSAVETGEPDEDIRAVEVQSFERYRLILDPARNLDGPVDHYRAFRIRGSRRG